MKILSRYILKEHISPFFFAFLTITFLLVIDYVPKIADSVMDKDISVWVALELLALNLAWMLALSIPMSALVATLMAFGRMTSDFETTAIKASGINIVRVLIPVLVVGGILTYLMIQFNDKILPDLNKQARELRGNISAMRPTLLFKSGIFITDIPGYLVLIDKINHTTSKVEKIRITETKDSHKPRLIVAEYGYLTMTDHNRNMQFDLYNGEIHSFDLKDKENYNRIEFENQIINVSGTGSELKRNESSYRSDREMSIDAMNDKVRLAFAQAVKQQDNMKVTLENRMDYLMADTFSYNINDSISDSAAFAMIKTDAANLEKTILQNKKRISTEAINMAKYKIEIYKKYSIPAAIISFILIGAPLGIMSRNKGMGMAIAISIILFVIYWAFLIGGEDLADRGIVSPFVAMWAANFLIGGIGLYLLYLVTTEKPLFSFFRKRKLDYK